MRASRRLGPLTLATALCLCLGSAAAAPQAPTRLEQVLDAVVAREAELGAELAGYRPLVETYIQTVKPSPTLGYLPVSDNYFIGRLQLDEVAGRPKEDKPRLRNGRQSLSLFQEFRSATFKPESFARMLVLDRNAFDRQHYDFEFVRAEFLGEVRTLVFDVTPKPAETRLRTTRFTGRIWAEDQAYHIVRFNGVYMSPMIGGMHFDSWRLEVAPGQWLPTYVYTEEPDRASRQQALVHRGQARIWGYAIERPDAEDEFTKVLIGSAQAEDTSERPGQVSPVESARAWEGEAEENVIRRLERAGLLAPAGLVDKVLGTVVANLEITNALAIEPPVRCRVLLTTPLESFTIGHTIVLSRGLLDTLPDEASLAMALAHELGHILGGHELDTRYAFSDQMLVGDRQAMERFDFQRDPLEEQEADDRAAALLEKSPYKAEMGKAGLFLRALADSADELPSLIRPHFGNRLAVRNAMLRMSRLMEGAPELDPLSLAQTAALPLGSRVKVDPWNASIELMNDNRVPLLSPREKMPFQITPLMPYVVRHGGGGKTPRPVAREARTDGTPQER